MSLYSLHIYRRRAPQETAGVLVDSIDIEANSPDAAIIDASARLEDLDWSAHFAGLMGDGFIKFWVNERS